jgi:hypothetical protein
MEIVPESGTGPVAFLSIAGTRAVWPRDPEYPPTPPPPPPPPPTFSLRRSFCLLLLPRVVHCTDVEMRVRLVDADYERIRKLHCPRANTKSSCTRSFNPTPGILFSQDRHSPAERPRVLRRYRKLQKPPSTRRRLRNQVIS